MYPKKQRNPDDQQQLEESRHNPEGYAARGLWSDEKFLANLTHLNPKLQHTQFADFHGQGWVFRAVYKQDRHGNLLDKDGKIVEDRSAANLRKAKIGRASCRER